jgi:hypothetical protein
MAFKFEVLQKQWSPLKNLRVSRGVAVEIQQVTVL